MQATGRVMAPKARSGGAWHSRPPRRAGYQGGTARLNRSRALGLAGASPVQLSDLPRTSSRFINKTPASVASEHLLAPPSSSENKGVVL